MKPLKFPRTFEMHTRKGKRFFTESVFRFRGFDEVVLKKQGKVFREVDPKRSKLFAGIAKGVSQLGIKGGETVLYLGASHGYTPSFVSDMVGRDGLVICVDVAPRVVRDLVFVCQARGNMIPVLADCKNPDTYARFVPEEVDVVFQDIAQRDQVGIFLKNCERFLRKGGFGILALKARSVDVTRKPAAVFREAFGVLERAKGFAVVDKRELAPLELDHILFVVKRL